MTTSTIPDAWLMGYMTMNRSATVRDAVMYWLDQEQMAVEWEQQHSVLTDSYER